MHIEGTTHYLLRMWSSKMGYQIIVCIVLEPIFLDPRKIISYYDEIFWKKDGVGLYEEKIWGECLEYIRSFFSILVRNLYTL